MLMTLCITGAWADEVTEKQAQDLAKSFVNSYFGKKGGDRSGLKSQGQMEKLGFYVFNMTDKGGFVIVSNESETTPILGYSETGSIELDPDKMPENMRNWLQGYADEIAWLQKQENYGKKKVESVNKARTRTAAKQPITNTILTTRWNQSAPYNNQCPIYSDNNRAVTGCVATAIAQVMKYHEWPKYEAMPTDQSHLQAIPAYTTESYEIAMSSLSAIYTFDWDNMSNTYTGSETGATADAVAQLMLYCGCSVEMDYGPSSASTTINVANALKKYFDYNNTTVTCVQRSLYTYANWIELIYHELYEGRPVIYGGQSSRGGHEFVCDGYENREGTDYFHINWGWGGKSDDYYVLSSLNPYAGQGIGGSSSDDGFHYGQDAVIGIQPKDGTGSIADISINNVDLALNGVTFSAYPTQDKEVTAYIDLKNNSSDVWDGDIGIRVYYYSDNTWYYVDDISNDFLIPANTLSTICQLTFIPEHSGLYGVKVYRPSETAGYLKWIGYTNNGSPTTLTVEPPSAILAPQNLTVSEITPTSAQISWTNIENATYNLQYGVAVEGNATTTKWLQYDNGEYDQNISFGYDETTWGVMYPGSMVTGNKLTKVAFYENDENKDKITLKIYSGGTNAPDTDRLLYSDEISPLGNGFHGFHEVTFESPVIITSGDNLWITLTEKGTYPIACWKSSTIDHNDEWFCVNGNWYLASVNAGASGIGWMIRGCIEIEAPAYTTNSWNTVTHVANPYQLTGLNPGTNYLVQVQAVYENGTSDWCESSFFTTPNGIVLDDTGNNTEVITETAEQTDNVVNVSLTNRTLYKDCAWNTLCVPFDMTSGQINADGSPLKDAVIKELDTETEYNFGDDGVHKTSLDSGGKLYLNFKTAENIEAGKPYIVKWATTGDPIINPMFNGVTVKSTAVSTSTNSGTITSVNSQDGSVSFIGTYKAQTFTETDGSVLFFGVNSEGKSTLYYPKPDLTDPNNPKYPSIGAQRAYFKLSAPTSQVRGFELNFGDEEQTTGILDARNKIENRGANEWYDLSGRKLSGKPTQKGVYVQNGRKVVIK